MRLLFSVFAFLSLGAALNASEAVSLSSPDKKIELRMRAALSAATGGWSGFEVRFQGKRLLQGELGLSVRGTNLLEQAVRKASRVRSSDSTYTVLFGKNSPVRDHFNELTLDLENSGGPVRKVQVVFRAYDDGVAYRYALPEQEGAESVEVTDEPGRFELVGDPQMWPLYRESYTTSHEGIYDSSRLSQLITNRLIDLPLLAEYAGGVSVALTEANLRNYAGLYVKAEGAAGQRRLRCKLSPLPGQNGVRVRSRLPLASPWRVMLIGTQPGRFIESNLIRNLNEPSVIGDTSWLKAGKTTWYWWNGPYQEPVDFKVGLNWETMKHYIDFCASNNIAFHAITSGMDNWTWYQQSVRGFGAGGPDTDVTKPRPELPMERVAEYARSKGVGLRLWVHQKPLGRQLEAAFEQYEKWGVAGLMVDFLDRDDQEMVLYAERILEAAARHHLHIQFHGVWKPTGMERTYPNLFNHEGVLNLEYLKWSDKGGPDHNVTVPFTRMVAGPMDYHLGGFRSVNREVFKPQYTKPNVLGTRCHNLAMYVVYENPMPMVADAPTAYEGQPGFDFLRHVPTTWDETRVLSGEVGKYIVVARRKGAEWYLGAMTGWTARDLKVPLRFLPRGKYQVEEWRDVANSEDPNQLAFEKRTMRANDKLQLRLNSGGGQVLRIRRAGEPT